MHRQRTTVLAVRPDAVVYAAARDGVNLPLPPLTPARDTSGAATCPQRQRPYGQVSH
jgi:hypothetical protein